MDGCTIILWNTINSQKRVVYVTKRIIKFKAYPNLNFEWLQYIFLDRKNAFNSG